MTKLPVGAFTRRCFSTACFWSSFDFFFLCISSAMETTNEEKKKQKEETWLRA
jgi:hypothetical protein